MKKKKLRSVLACILVLILAVTMLTGCTKNEMKSYRPITDLNNLEQRKIGVLIGWSTDYLLSGRDDLLLYRYDTAGDMIMALCYKQLDAIALDQVTANQIMNLTTGLGLVDGTLSIEAFNMYYAPERQDLCDAFNTWFEEYSKTAEYQEWLDRYLAFDGSNYEPINLEQTGTGETITLATYYDWYPIAYADSYGNTQGYEVEFMTAFANAMNYQVEFVPTTEEDLYMGTMSGMYDGYFGANSILYAEEGARAGYCITESFYEMPIVVLEIKDPDNLGVKAELDV